MRAAFCVLAHVRLTPLGHDNPPYGMTRSVFVGFKEVTIRYMIHMWTGARPVQGPAKACEERMMHDVLIGLAFIGMIFAPAIVAARSGNGEPDEVE
jgi:hypothetical protein